MGRRGQGSKPSRDWSSEVVLFHGFRMAAVRSLGCIVGSPVIFVFIVGKHLIITTFGIRVVNGFQGIVSPLDTIVMGPILCRIRSVREQLGRITRDRPYIRQVS
jgi:hypothetical protein